MTHRTILTVALAVLLTVTLAAPAAAATQTEAPVDECQNAEKGPGGDGGPPSFVADLVPDFLSDLLSGLPVPNFVKSAFGASTC
jgi:hypothetical protein